MESEIYKQLEALAFKRTIPFCYGCYIEAPSGCCHNCGSDDLMRLMPGIGCEYGVDWVIREILSEELEPVDIEEAFEQSIRDCYPKETKVGWMTFDTVTLMKENDPVGWRCALVDYESQEEADGNIVSFDGGATYYDARSVENLTEQNES